MKILVTGGMGFIGSHLVEKLLLLNHHVVVIDDLSVGKLKNLKKFKDSKKLDFHKLNITNFDKIQPLFRKVDVVFHLAALADIVPSIENPKKYFEANVTGSQNVFLSSLKHKVKKFIYTASSSCYGIPKKYPTREDSEINPKYPYALSKNIGEQLILHYSKLYGLSTTSLRLFNVYGPRARTSGTYGAVFGVFLGQKINSLPLTIVGNGKQKRDFTYVDDVVEALKTSMNRKQSGEIFNVGSARSVSVNHIANLIGGKKVNIPDRPGEPRQTFADIKKIQREMKWKPKISIEKGVKLLIQNINTFKDAPAWTPKKIKKATKLWFKYLS
tara:strand:- start:397 stop:1380 length:984 start_codon:yes stop_codon:yes gene_type:complete